MYIETGCDARSVFRQMFKTKREAINDINKWARLGNVYHSIYWYEKQEKKYKLNGDFKRMGPDYTTASIDKIVFDLDSWDKTEEEQIYNPNGLRSIRNFANWCEKHNYGRKYYFSGGGFYGILTAEGNPLKLRDAMFFVSRDADIDIDPTVIGDTGRMMRVLNSFNFKPERNRYCICLREEELELDFDDIRELAKEPRWDKCFLYGEKWFNIDSFKIDETKIKRKQLKASLHKNADAEKILAKYGWNTDLFCDTIKHILNKEHVGHYLRYELIKYFKTIVRMEYEDCVNLLAIYLGREGVHSFGEKQAEFIYTKNRVFNPAKLKRLGYCDSSCHKCMRLRFVI